MRPRTAVFVGLLVASVCGPRCQAEMMVEAWRSMRLTAPPSVSVNPTDGSCWVIDYASDQVVHLSPGGEELWRGGDVDLVEPMSVSVNAADGSCWVADYYQVVHLSETGDVLGRAEGFNDPLSVSVNPADGSCWVADFLNDQVAHLAQDATELWRGGGWYRPTSVSANPTDGSCWVGADQAVVHLSEEGDPLCGVGFPDVWDPESVSVNPTDGSCWVADWGRDEVRHVSASGQLMWGSGGFNGPKYVSVNTADGSCWVADTGNERMVHLSAEGDELWQGGAFIQPESVSVDPGDGSCWVGDPSNDQVVHLTTAGDELWRGGGFRRPWSVSVDPMDGSCWVADMGSDRVVHVSAEGAQLWRGWEFDYPASVSVSSGDGSCWVADRDDQQVVHLSAGGAELWRGGGFVEPVSVSVNSTDGSCWVADSDTAYGSVVHLSEGGDELWRGSGFYGPKCVSANPADGSCWVADTLNWDVVHLSSTGSELWRGGFAEPWSVSVNPTDGSCWVAGRGALHLSAEGEELWRGSWVYAPWSVSVDPSDGSCWVAAGHEVMHLSASGDELCRVGGFGSSLVSVCADPTDGSCWVADHGDSQVVHLVIDASGSLQADFSASPLAGSIPLAVSFADLSTGNPTVWSWDFGDGSASTDQNPSHIYTSPGIYDVSLTVSSASRTDAEVKVGYITVTFVDVPFGFWAADEVMACVDAGIVKGYADGTYQPGVSVTRDQMAVYVARAVAGGDGNVPDPGCSAPPFTDVDCSHWARKHIQFCVAEGIVKGYEDGSYQPGMEVTRDQMAVYIARAIVEPTCRAELGCYTPPSTPTFPDVPTDHWAFKHIEYCAQENVVKGYEDGYYHPERVVTRDQMAVYVARAFGLL